MTDYPAPTPSPLVINAENARYLRETGRWAKFFAVLGFIFCGLIALFGFFFTSMMGTLSQIQSPGAESLGMLKNFGGFFAVLYIGFAALYFFPCLYLFRFADHMKIALLEQNQARLDSSFANLKSMFKFLGILVLIVLGFYALIFLFALLAGGAALFNR
ncbi:DUF5362 family protein [Fibrella aquatilis]|uniref:DUF5362 domain-containing protein n=1 Tax=Fibrella aquatilis TaxID=2817059 RepID=A0A939G9U5_9BACT|nr:DUF5362 family protein [Fibrella aquatilis]MBO0933650.1 hypothetical protein [Fibrella aquatilis]